MGTKKVKESSTSSRRKTTPPIMISVKSTEDSTGPIAFVKEVVVETEPTQRPSRRSPSRSPKRSRRPSHRSTSRSPKRSRSPSPLRSTDHSGEEDNEDEQEYEDEPENPADTTDTLVIKPNDLHSTKATDDGSNTLTGSDKSAAEFRRNLLSEIRKVVEDKEVSFRKLTDIYTPELAKQLTDILSSVQTSMISREKADNSLALVLETVADTSASCYKDSSRLIKMLSDVIGEVRSTEHLFHKAVKQNDDLAIKVNTIQNTLNTIQASLAAHPSLEQGHHQLSPRAHAPVKPPYQAICALCQGDHWIYSCETYRTSQERKDRAKAINVCLQCGRRYKPDPSGKHTTCKRVDYPCSHCSQSSDRDYDETLHHPAFCSLKSKERMDILEQEQQINEQSRKRAIEEEPPLEQELTKKTPLQPPVFREHPSNTSSRGKRPRGSRGSRGGYKGQRPHP
ncbi:hypothetical protein CAEBREN_17538 [Caenorhabditis brenneri]|uniref:Uncharacterized protein n=1 Tax=Caenorhabditis brenneri TaxID=135651 RepID=G0N6W2_CAEBE|nr:hypothetical protein CAEBREN_17538 [Caenorhabditis brenneri]